MTELSPSDMVGVIGAGTMGAGIAQVAAKAGHQVLLYDVAEGAAQKGIEQVSSGLDKLVGRGKMAQGDKDALVERLRPVSDLQTFSDCSLIVEVIVENLEVKKNLFAQLEDICGEETILATNTSSISVTSIAADLKKPERVVGMHFFNPAPIMKLVEVVSGLATSPDVARCIYETATAWGKNAVYAKSTPGFIVNRVARPFYGEALRVLQEGGADIATIDAAMRECGGFRMGPFELMDLIGHDVNYAVTNSVYNAYYNDARFLPSLLQKELVEGGRLGRKSAIGFYDYREGAHNPSAAVAEPVTASFNKVSLSGNLKPIKGLVELLEKSSLSPDVQEDATKPGVISAGQANLMLSDGRFASVRSRDDAVEDLIHFDLCLDYGTAKHMVLAKALQASDQALNDAIALFQMLGKEVSVIQDVPGLIVMRSLAMLANEGADAVYQNVCSVQDVDIAMKGGVNYPKGPLEWADEVGMTTILSVLRGLGEAYGEDRYRVSPFILKAEAAGCGFYDMSDKE